MKALMSSLNLKEENERCSCCNKHEFWMCFDVFCDMDRYNGGVVTREDYIWSLKELGAVVGFQKVLRKGRLSAYFKSTTNAISLEELCERVFPNASPTDLQKMHRWANLRKAHRIFTRDDYKARDQETRQMFSLLDESESGTVALADLFRAALLSKTDIMDLIEYSHGPLKTHMNYREFCDVLRPSGERRKWDYEYFGPDARQFEGAVHKKLEAIRGASFLDKVGSAPENSDSYTSGIWLGA
jgi:Ca2+-binding EF-hand superfamily protein